MKDPRYFTSEEVKAYQARFTPEQRKENSSRLAKIGHAKGTAYKLTKTDNVAGGKARAAKLTQEERSVSARIAGLEGIKKLRTILTPEMIRSRNKKSWETRKHNLELKKQEQNNKPQ